MILAALSALWLPALSAEPTAVMAGLSPEEAAVAHAVQQESAARVACGHVAHAMLRGFELRQAGAEPSSLIELAAEMAGEPSLAEELAQAAAIGYAVTTPLQIGVQSIEVRESCIRDRTGLQPLTAASHAAVLGEEAIRARITCTAKIASHRPSSTVELQFLGCLPPSVIPYLPTSLGGRPMATEILSKDGAWVVQAKGVATGEMALSACALLNTAPALSKNMRAKCQIVEDRAQLSVERTLHAHAKDEELRFEQATQQILNQFEATTSPLPEIEALPRP